jgi:threonine synthase
MEVKTFSSFFIFLKMMKIVFCVFLETAHPVKFLDVVESTLPVKVEIPEQIKKIINNKKVAFKASSYQDLKDFLMK